MKTIKAIYIIVLFLSMPILAIDTNGTGGGDWTAGATWNGGVAPVNGDTAVILNGDTVVFDEDMSGWANGVTLTINAGGILDCETATGDYYLMTSTDITNNGEMWAGDDTTTTLPSDVTFTIDFNGGGGSFVCNSTGTINFYCLEPSNTVIALSGAEAAGQTELSVDTDVTADIWAVDDEIAIIDGIGTGYNAEDVERRTIDAGGISSDHLDVTAGLTNDKQSGAKVVLLTRNIIITGTTDYAFKDADNSDIYAFIDCGGMCYSCDYIDVGGTSYFTATGNYVNHYVDDYGTWVDDGLAGDTLHQYDQQVITYSGFFCGGFSSAFSYCYNVICDGEVFGCMNVDNGSSNCVFNNDSTKVYTGYTTTKETVVTGDLTDNNWAGFYRCFGMLITDCEIDASYQITEGGNLNLYNILFTGATEFNNYDLYSRSIANYVASYDHDQVANAFKAWCRGGIVTSQTASPPTGYDVWYEHACEDITQTYPVYRQFETTVQPGTALEVDGVIRIADGEDLTGYEPALQIIDKSADPLIESTNNPLDEDKIPEPDGSDASWQEVSVIWANQTDAPKTVIVRMIAWNDGGADDVDIDEAWAIADYQDQINTIYTVLMPLKTDVATSDTATSFTMTAGEATADAYNNMSVMVQDADDDHWELRSVTDWTAGRVITVDTAFSFTPAVDDLVYMMGTSYGAPTDNDAIADAVWDEATAGHTGESSFGGELGGLDPNITLILEDTGTTIPGLIADMNDPNEALIADSVWDEAIADHTTGTSFGGELQELDPNLTSVLADSNELQTDWTDGGRLDLLVDAIKLYTDLIVILETDVNDVTDAGEFTLADGNDTADFYNNYIIMVQDANDSQWELRFIDDWGTDLTVELNDDLNFTPAEDDLAYIMGLNYAGLLAEIISDLQDDSPVFVQNGNGGGSGSSSGTSSGVVTTGIGNAGCD